MASSTIRYLTLMEIELGGELLRIEQDAVDALVQREKFDVEKLLADDAADGDVTLFDIAANPVFSVAQPPRHLALVVDPDNEKDSVLSLNVQLTSTGGDKISVQRSRICPLLWTSLAMGVAPGSLTILTGFLSTVKVRNANAAPSSGTNDLAVRLLAFR